MPGSRADSVALDVTNAWKLYAATPALAGAHLRVSRGSIHALLGGNGSGKSTLIKILAGVVTAEAGGSIAVAGVSNELRSWTTARARLAGMRFVHQDPGVFPGMTVADNLALGGDYVDARIRVSRRKQNRHARDLLHRFGINVDPRDPIDSFGPATRTMIAIARALQDSDTSSSLLLLDEPTASLPRSEVQTLFAALRSYAEAGHTIVFVSHRLDEVLEIADRVTVLRDGVTVAEAETADLDTAKLANLIVGSELASASRVSRVVAPSVPRLSVRGLSAGPLAGVNFDVRQGQVLGIAGLLGSGRSTLLRAIFGEVAPRAGTVTIDERRLTARSPADAMRNGVAYVPEDRAADAAFAKMPIRWNVTIPDVGRHWRGWRYDGRAERKAAHRDLRSFGVRFTSGEREFGTLSGGNQQKTILARWLRLNPSVILLDEPTQGVDVGARADIYRIIHAAADQGAAVVVVSSDFEELVTSCDDIAVLADGQLYEPRPAADLTAEYLANAVVISKKATA